VVCDRPRFSSRLSFSLFVFSRSTAFQSSAGGLRRNQSHGDLTQPAGENLALGIGIGPSDVLCTGPPRSLSNVARLIASIAASSML
jgi:hypothetical protein